MIEQPFKDIDAWVAYYSQADLPVLKRTVLELEKLRDNAENVNAHVLAGIILQDPLMTMRVLAYIERRRGKNQNGDITTIARALMMIGINPFFRDFENLPLVEDQLKEYPKALLGLLKQIGRARKASSWAREWAVMRHDIDVDEIIVATLLYGGTEILMWCFAPSLALKIRDMQIQDPSLRSADLQESVYNVNLRELGLALADALHLPQLIRILIDPSHAELPRVRNVTLAVDLARHSANGWDNAALPDDFKEVEKLLHIDHETLMRKLGIDMAIYQTLPPEASPPSSVTAPLSATGQI